MILIAISLKWLIQAEWQSGYAADCNSVYAGSIPTRASILPLLFSCLRFRKITGVFPANVFLIFSISLSDFSVDFDYNGEMISCSRF